MAAAQDQRSYTTLAVIDGDARGMRSSDYAVVLRAVDRLRITPKPYGVTRKKPAAAMYGPDVLRSQPWRSVAHPSPAQRPPSG